MKPKINKVIYTLVGYQIAEGTVKFLGESSFLVNHFEDYTSDYEFNYDGYNVDWFTSFDKAEFTLRKKFEEEFPNEKFKLKERKDIYGRFWEA